YTINNTTSSAIGGYDNAWVAVIELPDGRVVPNNPNVWGDGNPRVIGEDGTGPGTNIIVLESVSDNQHYQPSVIPANGSITVNVGTRVE
ncbi:MAG: hypothetical protein FWG83_06630, partial [Oscillospiraceae bacterium]|nr:hypothetical protein [Oscillospiraceae bacterium]